MNDALAWVGLFVLIVLVVFLVVVLTSWNRFGAEPGLPFSSAWINQHLSQFKLVTATTFNGQEAYISRPHRAHDDSYYAAKKTEATSNGGTVPIVDSFNWSGYAVPFTKSVPIAISGSWIVPTLAPQYLNSPAASYSSAWIGFDGYTSSTVEQMGTESDFINGVQSNYLWVEMFPAGPFVFSGAGTIPNAGDRIQCIIQSCGDSLHFRMFAINWTQCTAICVPEAISTAASPVALSSAEWIVEAPFDNGILPLARFPNSIPFCDCRLSLCGRKEVGTISSQCSNLVQLTMTTPTGITKAAPSALQCGGTSFSIAWNRAQ